MNRGKTTFPRYLTPFLAVYLSGVSFKFGTTELQTNKQTKNMAQTVNYRKTNSTVPSVSAQEWLSTVLNIRCINQSPFVEEKRQKGHLFFQRLINQFAFLLFFLNILNMKYVAANEKPKCTCPH